MAFSIVLYLHKNERNFLSPNCLALNTNFIPPFEAGATMKIPLGITKNFQMSPISAISQNSFLVGTFFAVSYNKLALEGVTFASDLAMNSLYLGLNFFK